MEIEITTKTHQSLYARDSHTMSKAVGISGDLSPCIAPDSSACEQGVLHSFVSYGLAGSDLSNIMIEDQKSPNRDVNSTLDQPFHPRKSGCRTCQLQRAWFGLALRNHQGKIDRQRYRWQFGGRLVSRVARFWP
jgi:hypothetical protein